MRWGDEPEKREEREKRQRTCCMCAWLKYIVGLANFRARCQKLEPDDSEIRCREWTGSIDYVCAIFFPSSPCYMPKILVFSAKLNELHYRQPSTVYPNLVINHTNPMPSARAYETHHMRTPWPLLLFPTNFVLFSVYHSGLNPRSISFHTGSSYIGSMPFGWNIFYPSGQTSGPG